MLLLGLRGKKGKRRGKGEKKGTDLFSENGGRYEASARQIILADQIRLIRDALQRGQLTGTSRFVDEVERIVGARVERRARGRPRTESGK